MSRDQVPVNGITQRPCPWIAWRRTHTKLVVSLAEVLRIAGTVHHVEYAGGIPVHVTVPQIDAAPGVSYLVVPRLTPRGVATYRVWRHATAPTVIRDETAEIVSEPGAVGYATASDAVYALVKDRQTHTRGN